MGTPEFAVASLDALVQSGALVVGVITAPDKPAGRGMKVTESAVKKYAVEKNLLLLQPERLKAPDFIEALAALQADLQVVVAFRMLPEIVWNTPPFGTLNVHGSLLPQYRGAAPINWAVINGEKETGVTTFRLKHEIDTGDILLQEAFSIGENETAGEVHDRMKEIGAALLVKTVKGIAEGTLKEQPQTGIGDKTTLRHAPKIFTDTCRIDWNQPTAEIFNLIRGLSPFPAAFTELEGRTLKIFRAKKIELSAQVPPGIMQTDQKTYIHFATADGLISLLELQLEGKKRMDVEDFLRGYRFNT
ncbi:MAG: methionyl-tRNA formyltransferase [Chitinophagaceae bacterium]|nr:methionyl-tRNA formyltransferase [Chitinophagaceae bacterium]